jgi:hypothetical protein
MEKWNIGMVGKKNKYFKFIIPPFQYSNLFVLRNLRRTRFTSLNRPSRHADVPGDDDPLNLRGALSDLQELVIAVETLDPVFLH